MSQVDKLHYMSQISSFIFIFIVFYFIFFIKLFPLFYKIFKIRLLEKSRLLALFYNKYKTIYFFKFIFILDLLKCFYTYTLFFNYKKIRIKFNFFIYAFLNT